jgi:hypothetical protein
VVAHAFTPSRSLGMLRVRVALKGPQLDAQLAAGVDPVTSAELALRAGQLRSPRRRARFARSLRRAIASAEARTYARIPGRSSAVPVSRAAVLEARPELEALADDLVEIAHPRPRGVALTLQLLRDGGGPLYRPWAPANLRDAAEQARHAL